MTRAYASVEEPMSTESRPGEDGQSLVEFALCLPPLLVLMTGIFAFGIAVATWKNRANAHLDQAAFKAEYPKLHSKFMVKGSARVFEVKSIPTEVSNDERSNQVE